MEHQRTEPHREVSVAGGGHGRPCQAPDRLSAVRSGVCVAIGVNDCTSASISLLQASVRGITLSSGGPMDERPVAAQFRPGGIYVRLSDAPGSPARPRLPLAPVHPAAGMGRLRAADDRGRRGVRADRRGRPALPRRRLIALVQRPRPSPSADRPGGARSARPGRPFDDARPLPPRRRGARGAAGGARAARPVTRLLLRLGLDRGGGRAEDGLPVLAAARRPARAQALVRLPRGGLPRRHDRLGVGGRHGSLSRALRSAAVREPPRPARATSATWRSSSPATRRSSSA